MSDWTIPGDHVVSENFGAELEISSSHHDFRAGTYTAVLELRTAGGVWLGPQVTVFAGPDGATITKFNGGVLEFPAVTFNHAAVQALLDKATIVAFVSAKVPDPRA